MDQGFDREFYRSRRQRMLPVGPDGIQPYVRVTRSGRSSAPGSALRRLLPNLRRATASAVALWRWDAIGADMRQERCCR
jgi:hypothetical protein